VKNSRDILFDKCVYTIVNIKVIEQSQNNKDMSGSFIEKKSWKKAFDLKNQALQEDKLFLLMLADAAIINGVVAIAVIEEIELLADGGTKVSFSYAHWLREIPPLSKLRLLSSGEFLSDRFIRPYALCFTPEFAFEDYDYCSSHTSDDKAEPLIRENDDPNNGLGVSLQSLAPMTEDQFQQEVLEKAASETAESKERYNEPPGGLPVPPRNIISSSSGYNRNSSVAVHALKQASFKCEIDPTHKTFVSSAKGMPYIEAHHLVPFSRQGAYGVSLDVAANVVALCPMCHKLLHHGRTIDKKEFLKQLLSERATNLSEKEILLDEQTLLSYYSGDLLEGEA
jgi:hypothetical protein